MCSVKGTAVVHPKARRSQAKRQEGFIHVLGNFPIKRPGCGSMWQGAVECNGKDVCEKCMDCI